MTKKLLLITALVFLVSIGTFTSCCKECRDDFSQTIEEQFVALDAKIKDLEAKAAELGEDAKVKFAKAIVDVKTLMDAAKAKLKALKSAGEDAWQDMKPGLNAAMAELEKAFKKAKSHFK